MHKVFIKGLKMKCIIGLYPEERQHEQELIADVIMSCPSLEQAGRCRDLSLSINYAEVSALVRNYTMQRRALLLEELAVELADIIREKFKASGVTIRLIKPEAVPGAQGVGIEYSTESMR